VPRREEYLGAVVLEFELFLCYPRILVEVGPPGDWLVSFGLKPLICWLVAVLGPPEMSGLEIGYCWPFVDMGGRMCPFCCLNI
jgi:hypothetical protein